MDELAKLTEALYAGEKPQPTRVDESKKKSRKKSESRDGKPTPAPTKIPKKDKDPIKFEKREKDAFDQILEMEGGFHDDEYGEMDDASLVEEMGPEELVDAIADLINQYHESKESPAGDEDFGLEDGGDDLGLGEGYGYDEYDRTGKAKVLSKSHGRKLLSKKVKVKNKVKKNTGGKASVSISKSPRTGKPEKVNSGRKLRTTSVKDKSKKIRRGRDIFDL